MMLLGVYVSIVADLLSFVFSEAEAVEWSNLHDLRHGAGAVSCLCVNLGKSQEWSAHRGRAMGLGSQPGVKMKDDFTWTLDTD